MPTGRCRERGSGPWDPELAGGQHLPGEDIHHRGSALGGGIHSEFHPEHHPFPRGPLSSCLNPAGRTVSDGAVPPVVTNKDTPVGGSSWGRATVQQPRPLCAHEQLADLPCRGGGPVSPGSPAGPPCHWRQLSCWSIPSVPQTDIYATNRPDSSYADACAPCLG